MERCGKGDRSSSELGKRKRSGLREDDPRKRKKKHASCAVDDTIIIVEERKGFLNEEQAAISLTKDRKSRDEKCGRRLTAFSVHENNGELQSIDKVEESILYITGLILPLKDGKDEEMDTRIRCEGFGPIISWSLSGYDHENSPIVWLTTKEADYELVQPAKAYQKLFIPFLQKASACIHVNKTLSRRYEGNPNIGLDELVAKASHLLKERSCLPEETSAEDLIISWGRFIHRQLEGLEMDETSEDPIFQNLPVLLALRDASDNAGPSSRRKLKQARGELDIPEGYPATEYYKKPINEIDESAVVEGESSHCVDDDDEDDYYDDDDDDDDDGGGDDDDVDDCYYPEYGLDKWCLYSVKDGRFVPLEILPVKPPRDIQICCSGIMIEADNGRSSSNASQYSNRVPVTLGQIREWRIRLRSSEIIVSIRTGKAWYALEKPLAEYEKWYQPIVKIVNLVVSITKLLEELQFKEVVERVSGFSERHASYISSDSLAVEAFILNHGRFIWQLLVIHPHESIRSCAFLKSLEEHLGMIPTNTTSLGEHLHMIPSTSNTVKNIASQSRRRVVQSHEEPTMTSLISRVRDIFRADHDSAGLELDLEAFSSFRERRLRKNAGSANLVSVQWEGKQVENLPSGKVIYRQARVNAGSIQAGSSVIVEITEPEAKLVIYYIEYLFEDSNGWKAAHGRLMLGGLYTALAHPGNEREFFLTNHCIDFDLCHIKGIVTVDIRPNPWRHHQRKSNAERDAREKADAEERKRKGLPLVFFCRKLYCPEKGAFLCIKEDSIGIGNGHCDSCKLKESHNTPFELDESHFTFKGVRYHLKDFIYIAPQYDTLNEVEQGNADTDRNTPKPFVICQILEFERQEDSSENPDPSSTILKVRRFFRPDDISEDKAHRSDIREIYYSEEVISVSVEEIKGKCEVRKKEEMPISPTTYVYQHAFFCEKSYDHETGALKLFKGNLRGKQTDMSGRGKGKQPVMSGRGKGKQARKQKTGKQAVDDSQKEPLRTLDIFSGCGGLSSGLELAGIASVKWAMDNMDLIGEAFKKNHPGAKVFVNDSNALLRAIMSACGDADDCIASQDGIGLAAKLDKKVIDDLPRPGEVDFIIGGPPCQGFSRINRFQDGVWSQNQCKMVFTFMSYAEYYRPKFLLMENVRDIITHNKGGIFRFVIAALLEMGYQVRFGVLEAGAYGIGQNRKRAFIWAASPEENLPDWPEPMFAFRGHNLKIQLGDKIKIQYAAVPSTEHGAPFRMITVRDSIGDLPAVENGASELTLEYESEPVSWYQKQVRGDMQSLEDHICRKMDELNLLRISSVPKHPGADWHDMENKEVILSNGKKKDLLPDWLHDQSKKKQSWNGACGRMDWGGKFSTVVTLPQLMGRVGPWIHPEQDRLISVREYARAQGFPDSYQFAGGVRDKHRQIGNAVPPPLAFALGKKLKEAVEKKNSDSP